MSNADVAGVTDAVMADLEQTRRNVAALGTAIRAAHLTTVTPALTRSVQAQQNLYGQIESEFGLLTSSEAADRMGSRAAARRNAATAARGEGRLLALRHGRYLLFPGFQFDQQGVRPVIASLWAVAQEHDWIETSVIEWLVSPTTYLAGQRPVDVIDTPDRLLAAASESMGVSW